MELAIILVKQIAILHDIIADALDENTKPRQRLAIKKYLDDRFKKLAEKYLRASSDPQTTKQFLSGPKLEPGKSRFYTSQPLIGMNNTSGSY